MMKKRNFCSRILYLEDSSRSGNVALFWGRIHSPSYDSQALWQPPSQQSNSTVGAKTQRRMGWSKKTDTSICSKTMLGSCNLRSECPQGVGQHTPPPAKRHTAQPPPPGSCSELTSQLSRASTRGRVCPPQQPLGTQRCGMMDASLDSCPFKPSWCI